MTNLPMPMAPSRQDIQEMERLRAIMNGNVPAVQDPVQAHYAGGSAGVRKPINESVVPPAYVPSFGPDRADVDAMKALLEKMNALSGDEPQQSSQPQRLTESTPAPVTSSNYQILVSLVESNGKQVNRYNVVDNNRQDVVPGMVVKEAAAAIVKLLNKGHALSSSKVQEVVSLEEDFNRSRIETSRHKARYQRSMELGETAAAQVFKDRFSAARAQALATQDQIQSILDSIR